MKNKIISIALIAFLLIPVLGLLLSPIISCAEEDVIYISSAEELCEFSRCCSYDLWSVGKSFALSSDISLEGVDFEPIPSFSGSFNGAGYTISGLNIDGAYSPAGLFARLEEGAEICDVTVVGTVMPDEGAEMIGGIVGEALGKIDGCSFIGAIGGNEDVGGIAGKVGISGSILNCQVLGTIVGENRTGGIAGSNEGLICGAESFASVNNVSVSSGLTLDGLDSAFGLDLSKIKTIDGLTMTDTGGIAGYSVGILMSCENSGEVGYPHIGYNVGGIAGRGSGHLSGNINRGAVYGRKDVGGIIGQLEPDVSYDLSEDLILSLKGELDELNRLIKEAAKSVDSDKTVISNRINNLLAAIELSTMSVEEIANGIGDWGNGLISEINRASVILADTVSRLSDAAEYGPLITESLSLALSSLGDMIDSLEEVSDFTEEALSEFETAMDSAADAVAIIDGSLELIKEGLDDLSDSLLIEDEKKTAEALNAIINSLSSLTEAMRSLSETLGDIGEMLESGDILPEGVSNGILALSDAVEALTGSASKILDGVIVLSQNLSLDFSLLSDGLSKIVSGIESAADATDSMESALRDIADASSALKNASEAMGVTADHISVMTKHIQNATNDIGSMIDEVSSLLLYLKGIDPIQIPTPDQSVSKQADKLFAYIYFMESELYRINGDITSLSDTLIRLVADMNEAMANITDDITSIIYGLDDGIGVDDEISGDELWNITNGRVWDCQNYAEISGDINVGGISGSIGIESAADPEEDTDEELSIIQKKQYKLKAAIHACQSYGTVIAKYDCAGGTVGRMDFGLIYFCESYGSISSSSGDYVGGIVGLSAGTISDCLAKCTLSGEKYIGGIIGSGTDEDILGDSSLVVNCYSMVVISSYTKYAGAIGGVKTGNYTDNFFVSDTLSGIDRVSYGGMAEPISYEDLQKRRTLPQGFYVFTLSFVADGRVIKSVEFAYGESFDRSVYPGIPEKTGYFGYWDITELNALTFDTTVSVVYEPYITALPTEEKREGGRPIIYAEGEFIYSDTLTLADGSGAGLILPESYIYNYSISELLLLTIPDDGASGGRIHLIPKDDGCLIYVKEDGVWRMAQTSQFGSYLLLEVESDEVEIAVITQSLKALPIVTVGVILLALILTVILLCIKRKKKKAAGS